VGNLTLLRRHKPAHCHIINRVALDVLTAELCSSNRRVGTSLCPFLHPEIQKPHPHTHSRKSTLIRSHTHVHIHKLACTRTRHISTRHTYTPHTYKCTNMHEQQQTPHGHKPTFQQNFKFTHAGGFHFPTRNAPTLNKTY